MFVFQMGKPNKTSDCQKGNQTKCHTLFPCGNVPLMQKRQFIQCYCVTSGKSCQLLCVSSQWNCQLTGSFFNSFFFLLFLFICNTSFWLTPNGRNWLEKICMKHNERFCNIKFCKSLLMWLCNFGVDLRRALLLNLLLQNLQLQK